MKIAKSLLTPEEKKFVWSFYTYPGFLKEVSDALYAGKANPIEYDILGKKMLKIVKFSRKQRGGCLIVFSNGTMQTFGRYSAPRDESMYYDPENKEWYNQLIDIYVDAIIKTLPENLSEKFVAGMALNKIPYPFDTSLANLITEKTKECYSGNNIKDLVKSAMQHFVELNQDNLTVGNEECLQQTLFQVLRKYIAFKKLESSEQ